MAHCNIQANLRRRDMRRSLLGFSEEDVLRNTYSFWRMEIEIQLERILCVAMSSRMNEVLYTVVNYNRQPQILCEEFWQNIYCNRVGQNKENLQHKSISICWKYLHNENDLCPKEETSSNSMQLCYVGERNNILSLYLSISSPKAPYVRKTLSSVSKETLPRTISRKSCLKRGQTAGVHCIQKRKILKASLHKCSSQDESVRRTKKSRAFEAFNLQKLQVSKFDMYYIYIFEDMSSLVRLVRRTCQPCLLTLLP